MEWFIITAQKLVVKRINELCKEHNLNYYALAYKAAIPKSTLLNIIHGTNPTIETIQKICGGFDISLGTFFNTDYFYEIYDDEWNGEILHGLELAKTIRTNEPNALIIFLTSYSEYVFDVFEVITFDFLLKPITFKRFQKVLQKASTYLNMNKKLFSFSYCKKNFSIPCSEIMYIDKSGRKAFLHTPKSTYTLNMTLSNILTHVDPNLFGKIRSSCIVNLEYVQEVVRDELLLKNGESLFVSRNYRHTIKSQHLNFIRNHF